MHIIDWEEPSRVRSNAQRALPTSHNAPAAPSRLPLPPQRPPLGVEEPLLTSTVRGSAAVAGDVEEEGGPDGDFFFIINIKIYRLMKFYRFV
jgi:hypothetical protein